ncbi:hypothetical protein PR048_028987 [Dryococelus australis]|uniref:Uncharacterized protein n=1 Tax=Dryococelus australis TaxID=614101 RepID=A0ABQ9GC60_9NEOP|nr:hypothetical protein PR048_028987 [Dryococelus australis]
MGDPRENPHRFAKKPMSLGQHMVQQALQLLEESEHLKVKVIARPTELMAPKGGQRSVLDALGQQIIEENTGPSNKQVIAVGDTTIWWFYELLNKTMVYLNQKIAVTQRMKNLGSHTADHHVEGNKSTPTSQGKTERNNLIITKNISIVEIKKLHQKNLMLNFTVVAKNDAQETYLLRNAEGPSLSSRKLGHFLADVRSKSRKYVVGKTEVCKINQNCVDVALQKRNKNVFADGTKSGGKNKHPEDKVKEVVKHIESFPKYVSHYCLSETDAKLLNEDLNLSTMYEFYKSECNDPVSLSSYKSIFYSKFNLRFKSPKKDTCVKCDTHMALSKTYEGNALLEVKRLHDIHLQRATDLRSEVNKILKEVQTNQEVETLTFDLQTTHPLPKLPTNILYYKRQLNIYNLGIHAGLWTQGIGSCLMKYIRENIHPPVKKLILWSDSCGGQNRSIMFVLMFIYTLQNHVSLESITLRFLLSGHSFILTDSKFGGVKCALKIRLYTDTDYMNVMKFCRKEKKKVHDQHIE